MTTPGTLHATRTLFRDDFSRDGAIDAGLWNYNVWNPDGSSFYGRTQQRQELPAAENGVLRLKLDTFNPTGNAANPTFLGSEAISLQKFDLSQGGIAIEFVARYAQSQPGIVGGLFTFGGGGNHHDEIDFEGLSNRLSFIQTNVYKNEPPGAGRPEHHPLDQPITEFHTYRVEWLPTKVRWFVNDELVRENTSHVPTLPQAVHLNIWAPASEWAEAFSPTLAAASSAAQNQSFYFEVDSIKVDQLASYSGTGARDSLQGSENADYLHAGAGNDHLQGLAGDDVLDGGDGVDVARFSVNRNDVTVTVRDDGAVVVQNDAIGTNTLRNVELLQFNDQIILGRIPRDLEPTLFDADGYLAQYADVAAAVQAGTIQSAYAHYAAWGAGEHRDPNALFDEAWYLSRHADVAQAVEAGQLTSGFDHFQNHGWAENRDPSAYMDLSAYLAANPDVAAAGMNPLAHYLQHGAAEGRPLTADADFLLG
ncbi:MAG: glycoside hydrolase family 16 protein [Burkholderiaceae bacterium]|jgi:beta-glucanase (GH16 family)